MDSLAFSFKSSVAIDALEVCQKTLKFSQSLELVTGVLAELKQEQLSQKVTCHAVKRETDLHAVPIVLCVACGFVEFPACRKHQTLLSQLLPSGAAGCNNCARSTETHWLRCQRCHKKTTTEWWNISESQVSYAVKCMVSLTADAILDTFVLHCRTCHTTEFAGFGTRLIGNRFGMPYDPVGNRMMESTAWVLYHRNRSCQGKQIMLPVLLSKEEIHLLGSLLCTAPRLTGSVPSLFNYRRDIRSLSFSKDNKTVTCIGADAHVNVVLYDLPLNLEEDASVPHSLEVLVCNLGVHPGPISVGYCISTASVALPLGTEKYCIAVSSPDSSLLVEGDRKETNGKSWMTGDRISIVHRERVFEFFRNGKFFARLPLPADMPQDLYPAISLSRVNQQVHLCVI